jgi:hypothetical protein
MYDVPIEVTSLLQDKGISLSLNRNLYREHSHHGATVH